MGDPRGSVWRRWDPHIHAPGTVLNDQFGGSGSLDEYASRIESATPAIEAVGITDYFSTACYEAVHDAQQSGRLSDVTLIFPNVELRLGIGTGRNKAINLHLLVSPDDPRHLEHLHRFLGRLHFHYKGDKYACTQADLVRLGRTHASDDGIPEDAARKLGATQFKVDFRQLKEEYEDNDWMRKNSLVAVAGGSNDGTSGLQDTAGSFAAFRKEIEAFADIVFSGSDTQALFWRGEGRLSLHELERDYRGAKPCLHGSDAHCIEQVGQPDLQRLTWLKGDPIFETLRQACLEPATRVFIGPVPPELQNPERTISRVSTTGAPWLLDSGLALNPGMVAIIGARGSGKTALADLIAQGAGSALPTQSQDSFVTRARGFLDSAMVNLEWSDEALATRPLASRSAEDDADVHYLTQQFVERLCSPEAASDELIVEIQKVVFSAHEPSTRMEATTFDELLEARVGDTRRQRDYLRQRTDRISQDVLEERKLMRRLTPAKKALEQAEARLDADKKARNSIVQKGEQARAAYYDRLRTAVEGRERAIQAASRRLQQLGHLLAAVQQHNSDVFPQLRRELQDDFSELPLTEADWDAFVVRFSGDPVAVVRKHIATAEGQVDVLRKGEPVVQIAISSVPEALAKAPLPALKDALRSVAEEIGIDKKNAQRLTSLNERITATGLEIEKAKREVALCEGASDRIHALMEDRSVCYQQFFDLVVAEQAALGELYRPLEAQLSTASETVGRLRLVVVRDVDIDAWAERGEELLDLRKNGKFRGRGALAECAREALLPVWESGSAAEVAEAMSDFRSANDNDLITHANVDREKDPSGYQQWAVDIGRWLYSTDHINVTYSFEYEELPLSRLSPGTRGIVLLLLYLALDREDHRPLVIDQPEENLDPRSVFRELVELFRTARHRRQVIIVTHNANLVVNADVDQVVVASCTRHAEGEPPTFEYKSGSLEDAEIRAEVCEILEGGEAAFRQRARRLRVAGWS